MLVNTRGQVKLCDFGVSTQVHSFVCWTLERLVVGSEERVTFVLPSSPLCLWSSCQSLHSFSVQCFPRGLSRTFTLLHPIVLHPTKNKKQKKSRYNYDHIRNCKASLICIQERWRKAWATDNTPCHCVDVFFFFFSQSVYLCLDGKCCNMYVSIWDICLNTKSEYLLTSSYRHRFVETVFNF